MEPNRAEGFSPETQVYKDWPNQDEINEANEVVMALFSAAISDGAIDMKLNFGEFAYLVGQVSLLAFEAGRLKCLKELGFDEKATQQDAVDNLASLRESFWRKEG